MSRTYSSWRSLSSPNMRSSSTSENPITAFSGVRSSCDMLARNSDLWPLAISSSREVCTFWIAIAPWAANVVDQLDRAVVERRDRLAPEHDHAEHALGGEHRHAEHRVEAAELERALHRVLGVGLRVADLDGLTLRADAPDERPGPGLDRHARDVVAVGLRRAERDRDAVDVAVEHVDQPGVGAAQPHGLRRARSRTPGRARTRSGPAPPAPAPPPTGARSPRPGRARAPRCARSPASHGQSVIWRGHRFRRLVAAAQPVGEGDPSAPRARVREPAGAQRAAGGDRDGERARAGLALPQVASSHSAEHLGAGELGDRARGLGLGRVGQHARDLARVDGLQRHARPSATKPKRAVAANVRATSVWNCVARTIVHGTPERRIDGLLRELGPVVAPADAVDADDRDADMVRRAGRSARSSRAVPPTSTARPPCAASTTTSTPSSARVQPVAVAQVDGELGRAPRQHAHLVPALRRARAPSPRPRFPSRPRSRSACWSWSMTG